MTDFDFGFTAVDEDELEKVQELAQQTQTTSNEVAHLQNKIDKLYNSVLPLLTNLKKNPEKDYIYWPNRTEKIEQFEDVISGIVNE
jgi:uncharacterized protein Yka (UPF0111/DUF47 family)